jgi:hypothetical protein
LTTRLFAALLLSASFLLADGGAVQFRKQSGRLIMTLFTSPVPLRARGPADLSLLLQDAPSGATVDDAGIQLRLTHEGQSPIDAAATQSAAINKLLYAANVELPAAGRWDVSVNIRSRTAHQIVLGSFDVLPEQPPLLAYWPEFLVLPIAMALFAVNQWLKARRNAGRG